MEWIRADDQLSSLGLVAETEEQANTLVGLLNRLVVQCQDERTVSAGEKPFVVGQNMWGVVIVVVLTLRTIPVSLPIQTLHLSIPISPYSSLHLTCTKGVYRCFLYAHYVEYFVYEEE